MASSVPGVVTSGYVAERDMSGAAGAGEGYKWRFMEPGTAAGEFDRCDTAEEIVLGVLQDAPKAGFAGAIMQTGISKMEAGAAVTRGAQVTNDNVGRVVDAAGAGDMCHGVALEGCANAGEIISVLLTLNVAAHD